MKLLEKKITMIEMKKILDVINKDYTLQKKILVNLKTLQQKLSKINRERKKKNILNEQIISKLRKYFGHPTKYVISFSEKAEWIDNIFEEIMVDFFSQIW